jgi:hypothetical protein
MTKRRIHAEPRKRWTKAEDKLLRSKYPHMQTAKLVPLLPGRTLTTLYQHAAQLGLVKTPAYLASADACRLRRGGGVGSAHRFQKGQTSWNKGKSYQPGGRAKLTQWKTGHMPHNWKPVGSVRINSEGYRDIKITDLRRGALDWRGLHRLNWMAVHGPIPKGMFLRFKDGDRLNPLVGNLELVDRATHLFRNYHGRYPLELRRINQLRGALQRQINKREGKHERKHDQRSS